MVSKCDHNEMVPNDEPTRAWAWKCAKCGYVYGTATGDRGSIVLRRSLSDRWTGDTRTDNDNLRACGAPRSFTNPRRKHHELRPFRHLFA